ncbi:DUF7848 domain-containing protein [Streptomyces sp. NPDC001450]
MRRPSRRAPAGPVRFRPIVRPLRPVRVQCAVDGETSPTSEDFAEPQNWLLRQCGQNPDERQDRLPVTRPSRGGAPAVQRAWSTQLQVRPPVQSVRTSPPDVHAETRRVSCSLGQDRSSGTLFSRFKNRHALHVMRHRKHVKENTLRKTAGQRLALQKSGS